MHRYGTVFVLFDHLQFRKIHIEIGKYFLLVVHKIVVKIIFYIYMCVYVFSYNPQCSSLIRQQFSCLAIVNLLLYKLNSQHR